MPPAASSQADNLRLHIVEMVRNQDYDVTSFNYHNINTSNVRLRQMEYKPRENVSKLEVSKALINNSRFQQQGHIMNEVDYDHPLPTQQPAKLTSYNSKNRAAAWLLKRFHRRQVRHNDSINLPRNIMNSQAANYSIDLPRSKSGYLSVLMVDAIKEKESQKIHVTSEDAKTNPSKVESEKSDAKNSLIQPTQNHNNNAIVTKGGNQRIKDIEKESKGANDVRYETRKDKPRGVNKLVDILPSVPAFLKNDRRQGIFSASLENFKRRLRMASAKVDPLMDDKENRNETLNKTNIAMTHIPKPPEFPRDMMGAEIKPLSGIRPVIEAENGSGLNISARLENVENVNAQKPLQIANIQRNIKSARRETTESHRATDVILHLRKPLSRIGENEAGELELRSAQSKKQTTPAPLTVHNLRVHDSMQSAYERRMKRANPRPPTQLLLQQVESESYPSTPGDRMWRWLDEVRLEASSFEPQVVTVLALHSGADQTETPKTFKESIEIFV